MSFITPKIVKNLLPLTAESKTIVERGRANAKAIIDGKNDHVAIILGPCSVHCPEEALEYGKRVAEIQKIVDPKLQLFMRVYLEKPRSHAGWRGMAYDPDINQSNDIEKGILSSRKLLLDLTKMGVHLATEFLDPLIAPYFEECISWGFIGARTSNSTLHRQLASQMDFPIGFKNPLNGDLERAVASLSISRSKQTFLTMDQDGRLSKITSSGNQSTHLVLRGSDFGPNCNLESIINAHDIHKKFEIKQRLLIDCAHGNSGKDSERQKENFYQMIKLMQENPHLIIGVMVESYLSEGNQNPTTSRKQGVSLTDPCIDWKTTKELLLYASDALSNHLVTS